MNTTTIFTFSVVAAFLCGASRASQPPADAAEYLSFEQRIDGRCYNLSEGGKLMIMHNRHPDRRIEYRLIRFFAGVPQSGRTVGTIEPGENPIKLGCTEVDGRPQYWQVERSKFVME